jgi:hypothetical protein
MKIEFEFDTPHGMFRDALYLEDDHTFTDEEIQAMKQQRVDNWIALMTLPPVEDPQNQIKVDVEQYIKVVK